jgi:ubiquinone/menaquinone biosynthesis C-methylase UbiE
MGLKLDQVVPWGRSLREYTQMLDLTADDCQHFILDCGGGPASFNAELTKQGGRVVSCDPIYHFSAAEIADRIQDTSSVILQGVAQNLDDYVWTTIASPEELGKVRMAAMQQFLDDFPVGLQQGRYLPYELPRLPFPAEAFDLALCAHLLFTYSDRLSLSFHLAAIQELCRVAHEVRIFPLVTSSGERSPHLDTVINTLNGDGYSLQIRQVDYEFQRGGNQLLVVTQA